MHKLERILGKIEGQNESLIVDVSNLRKEITLVHKETKEAQKDIHVRIQETEKNINKLSKIQYTIITVASIAYTLLLTLGKSLL